MRIFTHFNRRRNILSNKENKKHLLSSSGPAIDVQVSLAHGFIHEISLFPSSENGLTCCFLSPQLNVALESQVIQWLKQYVQKQPSLLSLPFNWEGVSPFTLKVLGVLQKVPFGSTLSYGQVAQMLQHPTASRAVGGACGRNPFPLLIPCHRIISQGKDLCGFSEGIEIKKRLLAFEGCL
jgi:methylated-DNA-[protein]-cysteine S-methyltransferase